MGEAETQAPNLVGHVSMQPRVVAAHRSSSLLMALPGVVGVLVAPFWIYRFGVTPLDLVLFAVMYWWTLGFGLSVGYHRCFTHSAFRTSKVVRALMAIAGSMGAQGTPAYWVSVHRRHHERSDQEGDPHSPNLCGEGSIERLKGLWHGHYGWSLVYGLPNAMRYCPDIVRDPILAAVGRRYRTLVLVGLLLPALIGGLVTWSWVGAGSGLLWGGLLRLFVSSNSTWSLNSFCHRFGARPHDTSDQSRNNAWLALPTLGESWHNNHHAFPTSAAHGLGLWQVDLNYLCIFALEKLGLAWDVKRANPQASQPA